MVMVAGSRVGSGVGGATAWKRPGRASSCWGACVSGTAVGKAVSSGRIETGSGVGVACADAISTLPSSTYQMSPGVV